MKIIQYLLFKDKNTDRYIKTNMKGTALEEKRKQKVSEEMGVYVYK